MVSQLIDRRRFLGGAGAVVGAAALAACGGHGSDGPASEHSTSAAGSPTGSGAPATGGSTESAVSATDSPSGSGGAAATPAYVPFAGVQADLAAGPHGVPAGYYHYPANPPTSFSGPTGSGGTVTMMLGGLVPSPESKNAWWQGLNKALNVDVKFQLTAAADYPPKFQVAVAGGDIPDMAMFPSSTPRLPQILSSQFADLSEYLSGDAVKEYPNLASIPSTAWQVATLNGRIWAVPQPRVPAGNILSFRGDLLEKYGVASDVASGQDFLNLCAQLTDAKHNRWALGALPTSWVLPGVLEMMEAPNQWTQEDGKFVSVNSSPQMKDALSIVAQMWKKGYIHPDSFANPAQNITWWSGGTTALYFQDFSGWPAYAPVHPDWKLGAIRPPKWAGGGAAKKALGIPGSGWPVGFKKADPDRIKELLRVVSYIASPFGTKEYLTVNFGAAGVDYTLKGGDPTPISATATAEATPIAYVGSQLYAQLYLPGADDAVKAQHDYLSAVLPTGVSNAAQGLYSETALGAGAANQSLVSVQGDIIQGRKSVSAWDDAVKAWLGKSGSQMAKEYEQAYAMTH